MMKRLFNPQTLQTQEISVADDTLLVIVISKGEAPEFNNQECESEAAAITAAKVLTPDMWIF